MTWEKSPQPKSKQEIPITILCLKQLDTPDIMLSFNVEGITYISSVSEFEKIPATIQNQIEELYIWKSSE